MEWNSAPMGYAADAFNHAHQNVSTALAAGGDGGVKGAAAFERYKTRTWQATSAWSATGQKSGYWAASFSISMHTRAGHAAEAKFHLGLARASTSTALCKRH